MKSTFTYEMWEGSVGRTADIWASAAVGSMKDFKVCCDDGLLSQITSKRLLHGEGQLWQFCTPSELQSWCHNEALGKKQVGLQSLRVMYNCSLH